MQHSSTREIIDTDEWTKYGDGEPHCGVMSMVQTCLLHLHSPDDNAVISLETWVAIKATAT